MRLCNTCVLKDLCGTDYAEAVDYVGGYDEAIVWEGDGGAAARLSRAAPMEVSDDIVEPVQDCLDTRMLGECVLAAETDLALR